MELPFLFMLELTRMSELFPVILKLKCSSNVLNHLMLLCAGLKRWNVWGILIFWLNSTASDKPFR